MAKASDVDYIRFRCKACGKRLKVKAVAGGGQIVPCPRCNTMVTVPLSGEDARKVGEALSQRIDMPQDQPLAELRKTAAKSSPGLERLPDLDNFWAAVERLEGEVITWINQLLREEKLSQAKIVQEMHRIGDRRAERLVTLARSHSESLRKKARDVEKLGIGHTPAGQQRMRSVEWSLTVIESFLKYVQRVAPQ